VDGIVGETNARLYEKGIYATPSLEELLHHIDFESSTVSIEFYRATPNWVCKVQINCKGKEHFIEGEGWDRTRAAANCLLAILEDQEKNNWIAHT
jgi:hypothetical protein